MSKKAKKEMGKAARNELIKLKATFYNNLAVGLLLGVGLVPYFTLSQHTGLSAPTLVQWGSALIGVLVAFVASLSLREKARQAIKEMED